MDNIYRVCKRGKLKGDAGKGKVMMVFERKEVKLTDLKTPYRMSVPTVQRYDVELGEKMKESLSIWE